MRLTICISDHGWGHLGRTLVVIEAAQRRGHALQLVVAEAMAARVTAAAPAAALVTGRLDQGYVFGQGGQGADAAASRPLLAACAAGPGPELVQAVATWRPDVVLADATPWAPVLARAAGVPAVLCSNFSWDDQYAALYPGDGEAADDVAAVRAQVAAFDRALELPLGPGAPTVAARTPVPLLARRPSGASVPGLPRDRPAIVWAFGRTPPAAQPLAALRALAALAAAEGCTLVASEGLRAALASAPGPAPAVRFLPETTPWPDLLAAARLVVSKAGYSTLAEALRGGGHVIAIGVTGLAEERAMQAALDREGRGLHCAPVDAADVAGQVLSAARALLAAPPRPPRLEAGEEVVLDELERIAGTAHAAGG